MNKIIIITFLLPIIILSACDSGDIYPKENIQEVVDVKVNATFHLSNINAFPENYNIVFGTFIGTSPYPTSYQIVTKPENEEVSVMLDKIPKGTTALKLCLTDKIENKVIHSFFQYPLNETPKSDIDIMGEAINLSTFSRIQTQVFSQCLLCHGDGSTVSAGLHLTTSESYQQLMNIPSVVNPVKMRISPGNISGSFLIDILENATVAKYVHTKISTLKIPDDINLIKTWIADETSNEQ